MNFAKPEQNPVNESGTQANIDTLLTRLGSLPVPPPRWPVVYFLRKGDLVKIGFSELLSKRITTLESGAKGSLVLLGVVPGGYDLEQKYHLRFAHLRAHGEWFRAQEELLTAINDEASEPSAAPKPTYKVIAKAFIKKTRQNWGHREPRMIGAETNLGFWLNMLAEGETPVRLAGLNDALGIYERALRS